MRTSSKIMEGMKWFDLSPRWPDPSSNEIKRRRKNWQLTHYIFLTLWGTHTRSQSHLDHTLNIDWPLTSLVETRKILKKSVFVERRWVESRRVWGNSFLKYEIPEKNQMGRTFFLLLVKNQNDLRQFFLQKPLKLPLKQLRVKPSWWWWWLGRVLIPKLKNVIVPLSCHLNWDWASHIHQCTMLELGPQNLWISNSKCA